MKPSEASGNGLYAQSLVDMKLQAVSLGQLVRFLERVESPAHLVGIDKITIQENAREKGLLDVTLQLVSIDRVVAAAPR
jgi:general secretion pathway protein M